MAAPTLDDLRPHFPRWEILKDIIDSCIDITLNWRQSGHPGGSRSKVHALVATLPSGVMRWDIRRPEKRFGDRFVLVADHTNPAVYATLAVLDESLRVMHRRTGDPRYLVPDADSSCREIRLARPLPSRAAHRSRSPPAAVAVAARREPLPRASTSPFESATAAGSWEPATRPRGGAIHAAGDLDSS